MEIEGRERERGGGGKEEERNKNIEMERGKERCLGSITRGCVIVHQKSDCP